MNSRGLLLLSSIALLAAAALFGVLAFDSPLKALPVPSISAFPACARGGLKIDQMSNLTTGDVCYRIQLAAYQTGFLPSLRVYQSCAEIAEALIVVVVLCLLIPRLRAPKFLRRGVTLPGRVPIALIGLASFCIFFFGGSLDILYANTGYVPYISLVHILPNPAVVTVLGLVVASICFGALRVRKGLSEGVKSGVLFCALSVTVFQAGILIFDYKEMALFVTKFSEGWFLTGGGEFLGSSFVPIGVPLISNWFVFIVLSSLFVLGTLRRRGRI